MSHVKTNPIYNLKVVVQETGIKPDTLRAWERRYGLPQPERTAGGHRLYSDNDIEMIKWLIARQNEGMRINRAIELWKNLEREDQNPVVAVSQGVLERDSHPPLIVSGSNLEEMKKQWIDACLEFDERAAEYVLAQSFALYPLESVCLEVLQKGLSDIGSLWYSGNATVQQEHFAAALALRKLNSLIAASPPPTRIETILVACPPYEEHIFAPLLITLFLRHKGWNVVYLGADVPLADLGKAVDSTDARLVILNATMLFTAANLYEIGLFLQSRKLVFAYGGNIFNQLPELRQRIPGFFLGERLDQVVFRVGNLLSTVPILPKLESISSNYLTTASQFAENHFQIEAFIWEELKSDDINPSSLQIANEYLAKNILAALRLGNIEFLKPEINWVASLIKNHALPSGMLPDYLSSYADAITKFMPVNGYIIANFLRVESERLALPI
jgi:DNA-binding transcriptional MerR regulator